MTPELLLKKAVADGVTVVVDAGSVKVRGQRAAVERWTPILRQHKQQILAAELRRLVDAIARCAPSYWKQADIEEAVEIGSTDMDNAIQTFRAILAEYRAAGLKP